MLQLNKSEALMKKYFTSAKSLVGLFVGVLMLGLFVFTQPAYASIFDGSGSGSGGIFGGVRGRAEALFDSLFSKLPGGAIIQGPGTPPINNNPPPALTPPPGVPPAPNQGKQVKLTLEWDTISLGSEAVTPVIDDPLEDLHRPQIKCPNCPVAAAPTDDSNSSTVAAQTAPTQPESNQNSISPLTESAFAQTVTPQPDPFIWEFCPSAGCRVTSVQHVLAGWCGHEPELLVNGKVPSISIPSTGPNSFSLPNTVSNKYIRRDGYFFKCVRECFDGECVNENYMEFQTLVFPSNAVSLYIKAQNPSTQTVENTIVRLNSKTFDSGGEDPLPHNLDFMYVTDGNVFTPNSYSHPTTLSAKLQNYVATNGSDKPDWPAMFIRVINGVPLWLEQRPDVQDPQLVFGPFDLAPNEIKELPLQPTTAEISRIPDTTGSSNGSGGFNAVNPTTPCQCQTVRLHGSGFTCQDIVPNPTIDQCRLYYGIGKNNPSHAGGHTCDEAGITVYGCPPPWCFEGAVSSDGPLTSCPGGQKIPLASYYDPEEEQQSPFAGIDVEQFLPAEVAELFNPVPKVAEAYGCQNPCENDPPPAISGIGGLMPRDFNFICDPDDQQYGEMVELGRCQGTDPNILIKPNDPRFWYYRDVTPFGGCGYIPSSANSIIGPLEVSADYGGTEEERPSRSVILASIPIGGQLVDDQARPYGWPVTGEITQDWGYTGEANAQGYYRGNSAQDYGEFRYCAQ